MAIWRRRRGIKFPVSGTKPSRCPLFWSSLHLRVFARESCRSAALGLRVQILTLTELRITARRDAKVLATHLSSSSSIDRSPMFDVQSRGLLSNRTWRGSDRRNRIGPTGSRPWLLSITLRARPIPAGSIWIAPTGSATVRCSPRIETRDFRSPFSLRTPDFRPVTRDFAPGVFTGAN